MEEIIFCKNWMKKYKI